MLPPNPRPISMRKTVQLMVILTILAWATQTLFKQWGYGAIILPNAPSRAQQAMPQQYGITIEVRPDAKTEGSEVTLRQVCRWSDADDQAMAPMADIVLTRLSETLPVRQLSLEEIKSALHDAGANLSELHFSGSATCAIRRSEVDDETFIRMLKEQQAAEEDTASTTQPSDVEKMIADAPQTPLKDLLVTDFCDRLKLPSKQVEISFDDRDQATLILTSPRCRFEIDSSEATTLGNVTWDVTIRTDTTERKATIVAKALAYEDQLILTRPLSKGQKIIESDVAKKRTLVDKFAEKPLSEIAAVIGEQLARDAKRGDVLTAADVKPSPIVVKDQFITVSMKQGDMKVSTIARAMDVGAKGDTVRVKNEANGDVYSVIVTAPGEGEVRTVDVASTN